MPNELDRGSAVERISDGKFRAEIPDGWQQGRGAFGGLVIATLARALEASEADSTRPLRTLTAELCAPALPGEAIVTVETMRRGGAVSYLDARMTAPGSTEVIAHATAVFGGKRASPSKPVPPPPPPPPARDWKSVPVVPIQPPFGPVFAQHFEYRPTRAALESSDVPGAEGFVREKSTRERWDAPALIAHIDAWWPAFFALESAPRPAATVSFAVEIAADPASVPLGVPFFHRSFLDAERDGYMLERRELWLDGRVIALNQQTFLLLDRA